MVKVMRHKSSIEKLDIVILGGLNCLKKVEYSMMHG